VAELAQLRVDGRPVAEYVDGAELEAVLAPRPHLHPVRTLGGRPVTDAVPADHRWHLGLSVAVPDVDGRNFWGGRSYLRGRGYTWRADHGRIEHAGFDSLDTDATDDSDGTGFTERLRWTGPDGELLLTERRAVRARPAPGGWELELTTELANATDRVLELGSPATNGRTGAGYGGLFWRLPPAHDPRVRTSDTAGEQDVHGTTAPWLQWTEHGAGPFTLALAGADTATRADPWFVRVGGYPGIGSQLAAERPVPVPVGGAVARGLRVLVADGVLDRTAVDDWARARRSADRPDDRSADAAVPYPPR
jgi:hypothetical protein